MDSSAVGGFGVQLAAAFMRDRITRTNTVDPIAGSPAYERHRRYCDVSTSAIVGLGGGVVLQNETMEDVGEGIVAPIRTGELLSGLRLHPNDVAVHVTAVFMATTSVREALMSTLDECHGCTIRWPRERVRARVGRPWYNADHVARTFEFSELADGDACIPQELLSVTADSSQRGSSGHGSNQTSTPTMSIPFADGLSRGRDRRTYTRQNKVDHHPHRRQRSEYRASKVNLTSIRNVVAMSQCRKKCLEKIPEEDILGLRYQAWDSKSYSERGYWIRGVVGGAKVQYEVGGQERVKFAFKIGGLAVCNKCYGFAVGYSERQFKRLKTAARAGCVRAIHGNLGRIPEGTHVSAARALLEQYVAGSGCTQPHRHIKRISDGALVPLVLLPMNTRRIDVLDMVNEKMRVLGQQKNISRAAFYGMWRKEFTNVKIPPYSRFSKCQICWEYRNCIEAITNERVKETVRAQYQLHLTLQVEERQDYWRAKRDALMCPDDTLCLIVDGMDQNTTMVPKLRQSVKGIEGRYVKTHLCGVLVHGVALYTHLWFDAHHAHDSNQVVTSLAKVLGDVRSRRGSLPPVLRIQADNCGRENKNQYMFAYAASLVALGYFREVRLSFLIVGHTHEDIDQRFSVISSVLKRQDIESVKEMLALIERGASYTEAFTSATLMEHIWDWKGYITPHLYTGSETWKGTRQPHHFRFFVQSNETRIQYKMYSRDPQWTPEGGYKVLRSVPLVRTKPMFAPVQNADVRELQALDEFIKLKERQIARRTRVEANLAAIEETKWLKSYLSVFPRGNHVVTTMDPFWPDEYSSNASAPAEPEQTNTSCALEDQEAHDMLANLPAVETRTYFGPANLEARWVGTSGALASGMRPRARTTQNRMPRETQDRSVVARTNGEPFPAFDPQKDIGIGSFVAMCSPEHDRDLGAAFYVGKVRALNCIAGTDGMMHVIWYWPKMPRGSTDLPGEWHQRYARCLWRAWIPSREADDWVHVSSAMTAWKNGSTNIPLCTVHGEQVEKEIKIPDGEVHHILLHASAQVQAVDNQHLQR